MDQLKIDGHEVLYNCEARWDCPGCKRSRRYFCYFCLECSPDISGRIPRVELPFEVEIIQHDGETEGKSTAVHAKLLSPSQVKIYKYSEDLPALHPSTTWLLFPGPDAKEITTLDISPCDKIVVLDGTWVQAKKMARHPTLLALPRVSFTQRNTFFWRYQPLGPTFLSTIEAIYYCCRDFLDAADGSYDGRVDNLLWFFKFFYEIIQENYRNNRTRTFTTRHRDNYIKY